MKKLLIFLTIFTSIGSFTGCGLDPFSPILISPLVNGVITWIEGEAHKYYAHDTDTVYHATKRALRDMELNISRDDVESNGNYYIIAGENDRFKINIVQAEPKITKLSVRVNFMGDKPYAELFYKKVDEMLGGVEFGPDGRPTRRMMERHDFFPRRNP